MKLKAGLVAASLIALAPTAALANQSGGRQGPFLQPYSAAQQAAYDGAQSSCSSYGGLQSYQQVGVVQNAGYYAVQYTYVCNS